MFTFIINSIALQNIFIMPLAETWISIPFNQSKKQISHRPCCKISTFHCFLCPLALQSVILLVQRDCDITLTDNNGYLASHHAARHNKLDCLRFLVKQGSNIEATQADGKSPSHVVNAFFFMYIKFSAMLLDGFHFLTFCNFVLLISLFFLSIVY